MQPGVALPGRPSVPYRRSFLVPFPALAAVMGFGYLLGGDARTDVHTFFLIRSLLPIQVWGLVFLLGATVLTAALIAGRRGALTIALFFGAATYTWWAAALLITSLVDPLASVNAWAAYLFAAFAHYYATWRVWTRS